MNRKSFLILLLLLIVLGGAGIFLFNRNNGAWQGTQEGARPFKDVPVNDVAQIHLRDGHGQVTLVKGDKGWTIKEHGGAPADFQTIRDFLIRLPDVKVVQTQTVGTPLLPRLDLVDPGTGANAKPAAADAASQIGTRLELDDKGGKTMASVLLGKKVIKTEDSPLPVKPTSEVGRYVLMSGNPTVLLISDALTAAQADPAHWIAKPANPASPAAGTPAQSAGKAPQPTGTPGQAAAAPGGAAADVGAGGAAGAAGVSGATGSTGKTEGAPDHAAGKQAGTPPQPADNPSSVAKPAQPAK